MYSCNEFYKNITVATIFIVELSNTLAATCLLDYSLKMFSQLRQTAPAVVALICMVLLTVWITGTHAHRHVAWINGEHSLPVAGDGQRVHEHGHSHAIGLATDAATKFALDTPEHDEHSSLYSASLVHLDGLEDIESHALQPVSGKALPDLSLLALVSFAVFVLSRAKMLALVLIPDPPASKRAGWRLRPLLRGPPSISVV